MIGRALGFTKQRVSRPFVRGSVRRGFKRAKFLSSMNRVDKVTTRNEYGIKCWVCDKLYKEKKSECENGGCSSGLGR